MTEETKPRLYQVDPFKSREAILVHEFPAVTALLGIVETSPDVFHICTVNTTAASLGIYEDQNIYKVDMRAFSPDRVDSAEVSRVATVSQARLLNGLAFLGEGSGLLLASDSYAGVIWSIDIESGRSRIAINSTYTQPVAGSQLGLGVNGIRIHNGCLYFTNTDQMTLARVPINNQGLAIGDYQILAKATFTPDDFAVNADGDVYVTNAMPGANGLLFVPRGGGEAIPLAAMAGPTSAAFGRTEADRNIVYVSTTGGFEEYSSGQPITVSGKVIRVAVGRYGPE